MKVEITSRYKDGVRDNEGVCVTRILQEDLGFPEVNYITFGKVWQFEYPDHLGVEYAERLADDLVNTVLYNFKIRVVKEFGEGMT